MVGAPLEEGMEVALDLRLRDLGFIVCWAMNSDQEIDCGGSGASSWWPLPSYRVRGRLSTLLVVRAIPVATDGVTDVVPDEP